MPPIRHRPTVLIHYCRLDRNPVQIQFLRSILICSLFIGSAGVSHSHDLSLSSFELEKVSDPEIFEKAARNERQSVIIAINTKKSYREVVTDVKAQYHFRITPFTEKVFFDSAQYQAYRAECDRIAYALFPKTNDARARLTSIFYRPAFLVAEIEDSRVLSELLLHKDVKAVYAPSLESWNDDTSDLFDPSPPSVAR